MKRFIIVAAAAATLGTTPITLTPADAEMLHPGVRGIVLHKPHRVCVKWRFIHHRRVCVEWAWRRW